MSKSVSNLIITESTVIVNYIDENFQIDFQSINGIGAQFKNKLYEILLLILLMILKIRKILFKFKLIQKFSLILTLYINTNY